MGSLRTDAAGKAKAKQRKAENGDWQRTGSSWKKKEKWSSENRWVHYLRFFFWCYHKTVPPTYTNFEPTHFEDDHGSNNHGWYSLKAVLTHKGRSIDGGHYIAWTKQEDGRWVKFDDDTVSSLLIFRPLLFVLTRANKVTNKLSTKISQKRAKRSEA